MRHRRGPGIPASGLLPRRRRLRANLKHAFNLLFVFARVTEPLGHRVWVAGLFQRCVLE